jgi:DDE family transposase/transposase-like protein DUF772
MLRSIPPTLRASTPNLPDVPPLVQYLVGCFLPPLLAWFSEQLYRLVLTRCAAHPLVRLAQLYDFAPVVAACQSYYHRPGTKGTTPTYTLDQLVRAEFVRAWADSCGDPELEWLLASNLIARWFVDLPLLGPTPDHSTLNRFHTWLTDHQPSALFLDGLSFLEQIDPEDPSSTPQIVDTFALASPAAPSPAPDHLLRHLTRRLIAQWHAAAPTELQAAIPPLDLGPLYRVPIPRTQAERQRLLQQAVTVATWVVEGLRPHLLRLDRPLRDAVALQLGAIEKVIGDETTTDAAGLVQERPLSDKGDYRLMSALDLESTFRKHDGSQAVFGTNAVIATTATRIRACVALTGSTPDSEAPSAVLAQQQIAQQPLPPLLIMDQAGGLGKTRARVDAISCGRTTIVARIPQSGGVDLSRFTPADFRLSPDGTSCSCPNGVVSIHAYSKPGADGVHFRFLASQCRACPLWSECRDVNANQRGHRTVYITPYHLYLREAARFNASEVGKALLSSRWQVEPTIAWLTRYQGCRSSRRVGLASAQCQLFQACAVRNLLLWLSRLDRGLAQWPATADLHRAM